METQWFEIAIWQPDRVFMPTIGGNFLRADKGTGTDYKSA